MTGRRLLPKIGMRYKVLYILAFLLCANSLFLQIESPIITIGDKWYASIILLLLFLIANSTFSMSSFSWSLNKLLPSFYIIVLLSDVVLAMHGILQYIHIIPFHSHLGLSGSFDNPAGYAASLCAGFPAVFYIYMHYCSKLIRGSVILAGLCVIFVVVLSGSRAGILSIVVMCIVCFLQKTEIGSRKKYLLLLLLLFPVFVTLLYFFKKDSADGRLLIWKCSALMIKDNPVTGYGSGGFLANYMNYQAEYFARDTDNKYAMLAGDVKHPFNEYILLVVNYGLIGFLLFLTFVYFLWKCYRRNSCLETNIATVCLIGIAVFACFSYPLSYPFVWVMMIYSIYVIIFHAGYIAKYPQWLRRSMCLLIIGLSLAAFIYITRHILYTTAWNRTAKFSLIKQTDMTFARYNELLPKLGDNYLFLYNYAAELNYGKYYNQSQEMAEQCSELWADYNLQLLMADNCINTTQYDNAEKHLKLASLMCPARFVPLYELMKLYQLKGEEKKTIQIAEIILKKKVKVPSSKVEWIKEKAKNSVKSVIH